jgi:PBP1b-binding outer membrane lipoprotein LpoB
MKKQMFAAIIIALVLGGCSSGAQPKMCVPDFCNIWGQ